MDVEGICSHSPGGRTLSPEVGPLEEGVCPPELLMNCESSKAWQEVVSRIWDFSPQVLLLVLLPLFSGTSESAQLIFQETCEQLANIYAAAAESPVAPLVSLPSPIFPLVDTVFFTVLCFSWQVLGSRS